jgi:SAM-dependent methyltransferase
LVSILLLICFFFFVLQRPVPNKIALDVGCGTGQGTRPLAAYFDQVIGVDVSESQLEAARKTAGTPSNVSYQLVEFVDLKFSTVYIMIKIKNKKDGTTRGACSHVRLKFHVNLRALAPLNFFILVVQRRARTMMLTFNGQAGKR